MNVKQVANQLAKQVAQLVISHVQKKEMTSKIIHNIEMVHHFYFKYLNRFFYFLWDIESGSLHHIDEAAFLIYKKHNAIQMSQSELDKYKMLSKEVIDKVLEEFELLIADGLLFTEYKEINFRKNIDFVKALCLHICHDCNLSCQYCFANDGTYNLDKEYMSFETGKNAIDFLIANSGNIRNLEVDFFGGEPLLNFEVVKEIVKYAKLSTQEKGKNIYFTITTNCVNLNKSAMLFINEEMDNVVLSIDGREEIHDKMRTTKNNKGSYKLVIKNALAFQQIRGDEKYYVRGTYTSQNLDFTKDVFHLKDLGFKQISIEPVVLPNSHPLSIKEKDLEAIFKEYDNLAQSYLQMRKNGHWFNFFHYMLDLNDGPCINKRLTGCGAGAEYLAVAPNGDIFPCHQFVGEKHFLLGNVYTGLINQAIRESFSTNTVNNKKQCKNCFAKYYCGGGCPANAYNQDGKIEGQYHIGCEMTRKRFENSLAIWAIEKLLD